MSEDIVRWLLAVMPSHQIRASGRGVNVDSQSPDSEFSLDGLSKSFTDNFDGNAVVNSLEEPFHDQMHRLSPAQPAAHAIKQLLFINATTRGPVGTTDIIRFDLQSGDRIGTTGFAHQQTVVPLVSVGLLSVFCHLDHATPDAASVVPDHVFVEQIAFGVRRVMGLLCVVRDQLFAGGKGDSVNFRGGPFAVEEYILMDVGESSTQSPHGPLERSTRFDPTNLMSKMPDFIVPVLQLDVTQIGPRCE